MLLIFCCNCCIKRLLLLLPAVDKRLLLFPAEPVASKLALLLVLADPPLEAPAAFWLVELNNGFEIFKGWVFELWIWLFGSENTVVFVLSSSLT